jgi:hypothetical protein
MNKPYKPGTCCGSADCFMHGVSPSEVCWGDVEVAGEQAIGDDDYVWIHECEGHRDCFEEGSKFKPPEGLA